MTPPRPIETDELNIWDYPKPSIIERMVQFLRRNRNG